MKIRKFALCVYVAALASCQSIPRTGKTIPTEPWARCVFSAAQAMSITADSASDVAEAAMGRCGREQEDYRSVIASASPQIADQATQSARETLREKAISIVVETRTKVANNAQGGAPR